MRKSGDSLFTFSILSSVLSKVRRPDSERAGSSTSVLFILCSVFYLVLDDPSSEDGYTALLLDADNTPATTGSCG